MIIIIIFGVKTRKQTKLKQKSNIANKIAEGVRKQIEDKNQTTVYEIQDLVEKKLMASTRKEVAQNYITYRYNRDVARKSRTKEMFLEIIETKSNDVTRENANMNADTPAGMMMKQNL